MFQRKYTHKIQWKALLGNQPELIVCNAFIQQTERDKDLKALLKALECFRVWCKIFSTNVRPRRRGVRLIPVERYRSRSQTMRPGEDLENKNLKDDGKEGYGGNGHRGNTEQQDALLI